MRRVRTADGASAVEFALVLPLLVLFLFGIIAFGLAFARAQGMEAVAREAARTASIGREITVSDVVAAGRGASPTAIDPEDILFEIEAADDSVNQEGWCDEPGDPVRVEAFLDPDAVESYSLPIPSFGLVSSDYRSVGVFRCEAEHE